MNFASKSRILTSLLLLTLAVPSPSPAGEIRGFPAGQQVYYNGYYGVAPSYANVAPQTA